MDGARLDEGTDAGVAEGCLEVCIGTIARADGGPHTDPSAGTRVVLTPHRAAYWPGASTAIVADLHLGKGDAIRSLGVPLSRPVLTGLIAESLDRLSALVRSTGASRVVVVGDLLHAPAGITPDMVDQVAAWRRGVDIDLALVPGNHDKQLHRVIEAWGITLLSDPFVEGPFAFSHEPRGTEGRFTWAGHLHPAVVLRRGVDRLKLPCFHLSRDVGVLPAFSAFTAGGPIDGRPGDRVFAIAGPRVIEVPSGVA